MVHDPAFPNNRSKNPSCVVRSYHGPLAKELFILCRPDTDEKDISGQTISLYRVLSEALRQEGCFTNFVLQEMAFFRDLHEDWSAFQNQRSRAVSSQLGHAPYAPSISCIQQPPVNADQRIELLVYAILPQSGSLEAQPITALPLGQNGLAFWLGGHKHLWLANIGGIPGSYEDEVYTMFQAAEKVLQKEHLSFQDVVRTWIHLRNIDDAYSALNQGRTKFFRELGLTLMPASTGIAGIPPSPSQNMCLSLYAIETGARTVQCMSTATLNEAWTYGSDFSRGLRVEGKNGITLFISGTASIDEQGQTVHTGDLEAQAERMLLNISTLLANQKASWNDVVSAITYLKHPADASSLIRIFNKMQVPIFPNALVQASICRPDLFCEMEVIAILPPKPNAL
jgi:enamine deaminase RidA (YjgF/YER057c/UK114 family)